MTLTIRRRLSKNWPRARRGARAWLILACALAGIVLAPRSADAVLVFLRGQDKPVTGVLVRETSTEIYLREQTADGSWKERRIARSEVVDLIQTVSPERLTALAVEKPGEYRDYAEELSEKRQDPEALEASLRLYLIAAWLEPDSLGKSSLLGMIKLARSPEEERAFRAMAYLLDPAHDRSVLQAPAASASSAMAVTAATAAGRKLKDEDRDTLLKALQTVRSGSTASRRNLAKRANIKALLAPHSAVLSWEEFASAASGICPTCDKGFVKCAACDGTGKRAVGGSRINCSVCGGKRTVTCPDCGGQFATAPLSPALLAKILRLELALRGGDAPAVAAGAAPRAGEEASAPVEKWSEAAVSEVSMTRSLSLTTLTEFDPRLCLYRDGKWLAADAAGAAAGAASPAAGTGK